MVQKASVRNEAVAADANLKIQKSDKDKEIGANLQAQSLTSDELLQGVEQALKVFEPVPHGELLKRLLTDIQPVNFREKANLKDEKDRLQRKHYLVICVEEILATARRKNWGLCRQHGFVYLFNGAFWRLLDKETLQTFLGEAAEKIGVDRFDTNYHKFRDELLKQFFAVAHLPQPTPPKDAVFVNLQNGTFEIHPDKQFLREPRLEDFITHQLPFAHNTAANAPKFQTFLQRVLPDLESQLVLAEYLGYVFVKKSVLKLETALLLYGGGANGKSVFFEIVQALFGKENVSSYSLQSLTNENGYFRAKLANVLVNYASEINGRLQTQYFKALASGEPLEARLPYCEPFMLEDYAKLIFNCNELPREVEHTHAFFRRWLIIPFLVTIPEAEQDKQLAQKIIETELSGVFNWVLAGLRRLLIQKRFSKCDAAERQLEQFKKESDNVLLFLEDEDLEPSTEHITPLKTLYSNFREYCRESGAIACKLTPFGNRLRNAGYTLQKKNIGQVVFIQKK